VLQPIFVISFRSAEPLYPARFCISTSCAKQAYEKAIPSSRLRNFDIEDWIFDRELLGPLLAGVEKRWRRCVKMMAWEVKYD